jgi:hypothetical protein
MVYFFILTCVFVCVFLSIQKVTINVVPYHPKEEEEEESQEESQEVSQEEFNLSLFRQLNGNLELICWNWVRCYVSYLVSDKISNTKYVGSHLHMPNMGHNHFLVYYWEYDHMVLYPNFSLPWLKKICVHIEAMYTENIPHFTNHGVEIGCVRSCFVEDGVLTSHPLHNVKELPSGEILLLIVAPPYDVPMLSELTSFVLDPTTL